MRDERSADFREARPHRREQACPCSAERARDECTDAATSVSRNVRATKRGLVALPAAVTRAATRSERAAELARRWPEACIVSRQEDPCC